MTDQEVAPAPDLLDVLVDQLLACAAPISQMMAGMKEFEASGLSSPDAPPIFEVAHSLIRSAVDDLRDRSDDEILISAEVVAQATIAICENIFVVPQSEIRRSTRGSAGSHRRRRRRSGRRPSHS